MQETLQVPSKIEFFIEPTKTKFYAKLTVKNLEGKRKAFKIKTNSKDRYIVNPSASMLDPYQQMDVEFALSLPTPGFRLESLQTDRFRLIVIDINDANVTKNNIEEYLAKNDVSVKKINIQVVAVAKDGSSFLSHGSSSSGAFATGTETTQLNFQKQTLQTSAPAPEGRDNFASKTSIPTSTYPSADPKKISFGSSNQDQAFDVDSQEELKRLREKKLALERQIKQMTVL